MTRGECGFCHGKPVGNAATWQDGKPRPPAPCPRCGNVAAAPEPLHGLCQCGCGQMTQPARFTNRRRGWVKGEPLPFLQGHMANRRKYSYTYTVDAETGCWEWDGRRQNRGYGVMSVAGREVYAHRFFYEEAKGPIPDGLELDHLCRNRACVNPAHLEVVTGAENTRRGVNTKLSADDVADIRWRRIAMGESLEQIAERYGVHSSHVSRIATGRKWRPVDKASSVVAAKRQDALDGQFDDRVGRDD